MSLKCNKTVMVKYHNILYNKKTKKGTEENEKPWKPWYTIYIYIYIDKFNQRIRNKIDTNKMKIYGKKKPVLDTG